MKSSLQRTPTPRHNAAGISMAFHSGFTLIELLVVIAIIGLLSSIVFASLNSARQKARDARRKTDLSQIQRALEFYYDKHSGYPNDTVGDWEQPCKTATPDIGKIVTEGFIPVLPCDPVNSGNSGNGLGYYFDPGTCSGGFCQSYCLFANLETGGKHSIYISNADLPC